MSTDTPETRKAWDDCKHNDFPHIAGVMFEKSQSLERRNSELTARIAELERQVACVNHYIPLAIRDSEAFVKMEAALAEARKDSAWQPIETAPKDGTKILVAAPMFQVGPELFQTVARFERELWLEGPLESSTEIWPPTHWMPLPATPLPETKDRRL